MKSGGNLEASPNSGGMAQSPPPVETPLGRIYLFIAPCYSSWSRALTLTSDGAGAGGDWPAVSSGPTDDEGLMTGVLAALRSSSLSADEQQQRLNAMIVELQQLRRNLETSSSSSSSSASIVPPPRACRSSPVRLTTIID